MQLLKWGAIAVGLVALPIVVIAIAGVFVPREHKASVRVALNAPVETVWPLVEKIEEWPAWNPSIAIKRIADSPEGRPRYSWSTKGDEIPSEVIESANGRLVTKILDEKLPFGGTWTWEVAPAASGSTVTITEDGFIKNTVFRFLAHHVFGYTSTMEQTLAALSQKVGGGAPEVVAKGK